MESLHDVVDISLVLYQAVLISLIPSSTSLLEETLKLMGLSLGHFKPEPLQVEPRVPQDIKLQNHKPTQSSTVTVKEQPQKLFVLNSSKLFRYISRTDVLEYDYGTVLEPFLIFYYNSRSVQQD